MSNASQVMLPVRAVREAAERTIRHIQDDRQKSIERLVQRKMNRRFFPITDPLRAREIVKQSQDGRFLRVKHGLQESRAKIILAACRVHQGETIMLSFDDFDYIADEYQG